ncbi:MAG: DUF4367 domain-containing protein [Lachnospiraceae bacterium]|nr:DUF4367 domain-containing protein [Lachnospiraceae bacterium]
MTRKEKNKVWFDALLKVAISESLKNEMDLLPTKEELDNKYIPSAIMDRRIRKLIIRNRIKHKTHAYVKTMRKIAASIIIIITASSITLLSVKATRNAIFNAFIERFEKYTEIKFNDNTMNSKENNIYSPIYLPAGFKKISVKTYGNSVMQIYSDDAGKKICFEQWLADTGTALIDNENTKYSEIEMNGDTAYLFESLSEDDYNVLLWQSNGMVYELTSQINSNELILIGCSLEK